MKKYIKPILLLVSWITYLDLVVHPNKGFHFFSIFPRFQFSIVIILLLSLTIQIVDAFSKATLPNSWKKKAQVIFIVASLLILNEVFFDFQFNSLNLILELSIAIILSIPIVFITMDFLEKNNSRNHYVLTLGLFISILTFIYFKYFYTPHEDYFNEIAILFIHHWIRNWIIFIGLILVLASTFNIYKTTVNTR
jgi:hypothetical protein